MFSATLLLAIVSVPPQAPTVPQAPALPQAPTRTAALPADRTQDAVPATDGPKHPPAVEPVGRSKRAAAYHALLREVERTGREAVYESCGPADQGWMLPKGRYRIVRDKDGDAAYEELNFGVQNIPKNIPARSRRWNEDAVPIPWPDPSMADPLIVFPRDGGVIRDFRNTQDCMGQS